MVKEFLVFLFKTGLMAGVKMSQDYPDLVSKVDIYEMSDVFQKIAEEGVEEAIKEHNVKLPEEMD